MSDFRRLSDSVLASPQLTVDDLASARTAGVGMVVNNRPEGEAADQTPGPVIEAAARAAGMDYRCIPISHGDFGEAKVRQMLEALDSADGKVLAYCRTGTRSTLLWALAQAARGMPLEAIVEAAATAGYDVSPVGPAMIALARNTQR